MFKLDFRTKYDRFLKSIVYFGPKSLTNVTFYKTSSTNKEILECNFNTKNNDYMTYNK